MVELRYYERICRLMMMIGLRLPALYQSLPQTSQSAIGPSSPLAARPTDLYAAAAAAKPWLAAVHPLASCAGAKDEKVQQVYLNISIFYKRCLEGFFL